MWRVLEIKATNLAGRSHMSWNGSEVFYPSVLGSCHQNSLPGKSEGKGTWLLGARGSKQEMVPQLDVVIMQSTLFRLRTNVSKYSLHNSSVCLPSWRDGESREITTLAALLGPAHRAPAREKPVEERAYSRSEEGPGAEGWVLAPSPPLPSCSTSGELSLLLPHLLCMYTKALKTRPTWLPKVGCEDSIRKRV